MFVVNPNYENPLVTWAEANKQGFANWLAAPEQASRETISFEDIRAAFPNATPPGGEGLTDGVIQLILQALGYQVRDDG